MKEYLTNLYKLNPIKKIKEISDKRKEEKLYDELADIYTDYIHPKIKSLIGKGLISDIKCSVGEELQKPYGELTLPVKIKITLSDDVKSLIEHTTNKFLPKYKFKMTYNIGELPAMIFIGDNSHFICDSQSILCEIPSLSITDGQIKKSDKTSKTTVSINSIRGHDIKVVIDNFIDAFVNKYSRTLCTLYNQRESDLKEQNFLNIINVNVLEDIMIDIIDMSDEHSILQSGSNPWFVCDFKIKDIHIYKQEKSERVRSASYYQTVNLSISKSSFRLTDGMIGLMDALIAMYNRLKSLHSNLVINIEMENNHIKILVMDDTDKKK